MIRSQSKLFLFLLIGSAFLVAANAAFFSITGLSHFFAGAFWSVVIMAFSLEVGKLVAASFLYRFWDKLNKILKVYLLSSVIILVGITSIGIFGFLSKAYQGATVELEQTNLEVALLEEQLKQLIENKQFLQQELEEQVATLPVNYITAKRKVREQYLPQINNISKEVLQLHLSLGKSKQRLITTGVDVGPLLYVSNAFNTSMDQVAKWLIFLLIFVFDPLALALVIAVNIVLQERYLNSANSVLEKSSTITKHTEPGSEIEFQKEAKEKQQKKFLPY